MAGITQELKLDGVLGIFTDTDTTPLHAFEWTPQEDYSAGNCTAKPLSLSPYLNSDCRGGAKIMPDFPEMSVNNFIPQRIRNSHRDFDQKHPNLLDLMVVDGDTREYSCQRDFKISSSVEIGIGNYVNLFSRGWMSVG